MPSYVNWHGKHTLLGLTLTLDEWSRKPVCVVGRDELGERVTAGWPLVRALMKPSERGGQETDLPPPSTADKPIEPPEVKPPVPIRKWKGITKRKQGWQAQIKIADQLVYLGTWPTPEEAARRYDKEVLALGLPRELNFKH